VTGAPGRTRVRVTNAGASAFAGPVKVGLYVSPDPWLDPEDTALTAALRTLKLRPGRSKMVPVRFAFPDVPDGSYYLLGYADADKAVPETSETNIVAASPAAVTIAAAFVDLSASFAAMTVTPPPNRRGLATLLVRNAGNVPARGLLSVTLTASSDQAPDPGDVPLGTKALKINIKPGAARPLRLRFAPASGLVSGQYYVIATLDPANAIAERDESNNTAVSSNAFTVG